MLEAQVRVITKRIIVVGTLTGSALVGLAALFPLARTVAAPMRSCPGIYYQEPFNRTHRVPQGCPPNAATQILIERGEDLGQPVNIPAPSTPIRPIQPPLPETQEAPINNITLVSGKVDVVLQNNTNAIVAYQAVGYTEEQYLRGQETRILQDLPAPVTITLYRQDNGLLRITSTSTTGAGVLNVALDETTELGENQGTLRVQQDGQVFLN
jgi:hypothetical protein